MTRRDYEQSLCQPTGLDLDIVCTSHMACDLGSGSGLGVVVGWFGEQKGVQPAISIRFGLS